MSEEQIQRDLRLLDFRNFLYLIWKRERLPEPSPIQYDIASYLQDDTIRRKMVEAFRGVGKSWETDAFVAFLLYRNPNTKILLVSASSSKAEQSLQFIKHIIRDTPFLKHLTPRDDQRNTTGHFDVNGCFADEAPSVRAAGITGQITGGRADVIIADDVEIPKNALTSVQRQRLAEAVKEFDAILKPGGTIIYLGTPQTEQSIYNLLPDRGYKIRVWPARVPEADSMASIYGGRLSPLIAKMVTDGLVGQPTEPTRFTEQDLFERELSYGRTGFRLQFMLDTRLTDANKYPLRLSDLVVIDTHTELAPQNVIWGSTSDLHLEELPCVGLNGDRWYRPSKIQEGDWIKYTGAVMSIDPAGRGKDETSYAVVKCLNGILYLVDAGGLKGGYTPENLQLLANLVKTHNVNKLRIESNFGDGMFKELLSPYLFNTQPVSVEEIRQSKQKELRIIDTLEPIMNQHRLVVDKSLIIRDASDKNTSEGEDNSYQYQLFWQMSRITREKGCLPHDDRIDVLADACSEFVEAMAVEATKAIDALREAKSDESYQQFISSFNSTWNSEGSDSEVLWSGRKL